MGKADYLDRDSYNAICQRCSFKFKAKDIKEEWNGLRVCESCWEPRHPQDFVRGIPDDSSVPWALPDSDADTSTTDVGGNALNTVNQIETYGDEDVTLTWGTGSNVVQFTTALTVNRTITLAGTPDDRSIYTIYRTAGGAFTLDVGGVRTIAADVNAVVVIQYSSVTSAWFEVSYNSLGL